ncbi:bifunctional acetate--CoA ligase family protein/GNAT family N-acetyltransferase [Chromobacterium violaceum]|uniref:Succinyl-CoA synthetase subunit beta n=1 Tax=Chromobacterium violaceum TaxID=536 RepID=A0AAX2MC51_CHRVL|nr:bifunctional acetate--CoA ligase family protein/GNAT family N-acetyltransferase [Chromobacterium violaceum]OLZ85806.1 GNAT family N-acetyltransferase [Chromobacterium violaceum]STB65019.1 succinyl-CoA synthetase subunit beta [Chromobacterium violaceum]SUX33947.1 succinyl-CoA synthetase subunit beta [Chromobacterium violaceum]
MRPHYLTPLFSPRTVAVVGASDRPGSIGQAVFANLLASSFQGKLFPVNLNHKVVGGMPAVASVRQIEEPVDLAVVVTAIRSLPAVVKDCGKKGVKAVLLAKEFSDSEQLEQELINEAQSIARHFGVRILGPNVLGLMRPVAGFNASNYSGKVRPGNLALVSESSALCAAMLDWADSKEIGFSSVISLGGALDVGFGEILDYLVADNATQGILLHVHHIHDARRFMSALRAAARTKPVVVIKSGRFENDASGLTHASNLVASGDAFDAALARAGVLRVSSIAQLFTAAKVLAANYRVGGRRLAIVTNGFGPGMLAADSAIDYGVELARLSEGTVKLLDSVLPRNWSHGNPLDIIGDASPMRFRTAVKACVDDPGVDGVMVIFTPQAGTDHLTTAQLMIGLQRETTKPLFLSWLGDAKVSESRELFSKAKCAHFRAPEYGIEVFSHLADYQRNQQLLLQTPGPLEGRRNDPDVNTARKVMDAALAEGRTVLSERESKQVLAAFHIPVNPTTLARTADQAVKQAAKIGYPVVLKIDSPDIIYKSDVGGVELNISNEETLRTAFDAIVSRTRQARPEARIDGVSVQPMRKRRFARELMVGVARDAGLGPVIAFGAGGIAVEVMRDLALSLPPLNDYLVDSMIGQTRIGQLLGPFKNLPPVDVDELRHVLLQVSEMVCELPQLREMDINPLVADEQGVIALDARIFVGPARADQKRYGHMAIMPYPTHMVVCAKLHDGTPVMIRPIRPEDADMQQAFVRNLSEESRYNRYLSSIKQLSQSMLVRFTQLDYDREMALAMTRDGEGGEEMLAVARFITDPDNEACEFALEVADDWQGRGIGTLLMQALFDAAREQGLKLMRGEVLAGNKGMLKLMHKLGFSVEPHPEDRALTLVLKTL